MDTLKKEERQPHKMVKQTQNIRRQKPTNCLSVFDHYVGLMLKGLIAENWKKLSGLGPPNYAIYLLIILLMTTS